MTDIPADVPKVGALVTYLKGRYAADQAWIHEWARLLKGNLDQGDTDPGDPTRMLADLDAKFMLLGLHIYCPDHCYVLRVLAHPYAGDPEFRKLWRV